MLGERIKKARKDNKLTQKQLAEMINVSNTSISDWENDLHSPNIELLKKLSSALGVDITWFYTNDQLEMITNTTTDDWLTASGNQLPEEAKKELQSFIEYLKAKYKKD